VGFDWSEFAGPSGDEEKWVWDTKGQTLEGVVRRLQAVETKFGRSPVASIETEDGTIYTLWIRQNALQKVMAKEAPTVGDTVRITFTDEVDTGKGNPAKLFDLEVERDDKGEPVPAAAPQADDDEWG
jgi:hypothetical protein